jgi:hypothetical protein
MRHLHLVASEKEYPHKNPTANHALVITYWKSILMLRRWVGAFFQSIIAQCWPRLAATGALSDLPRYRKG